MLCRFRSVFRNPDRSELCRIPAIFPSLSLSQISEAQSNFCRLTRIGLISSEFWKRYRKIVWIRLKLDQFSEKTWLWANKSNHQLSLQNSLDQWRVCKCKCLIDEPSKILDFHLTFPCTTWSPAQSICQLLPLLAQYVPSTWKCLLIFLLHFCLQQSNGNWWHISPAYHDSPTLASSKIAISTLLPSHMLVLS